MILSGKIQAFKHVKRAGREARLVQTGKIYVPGRSAPPPKAIFNADQRNHVVQTLRAIINEAKPTVFAVEGALVHGVRGSLCLKGYSYRQADAEARAVVGAALTSTGVPRPSHEQAQREYTVPNEHCSWCYSPIPDELMVGNHRKRFCSEMCARSAQVWRSRDEESKYDDNYRSAAAAIHRMRLPAVPCRQCGKKFHPEHLGRNLCSPECSAAASRIHQERPCDQCGTMFHPKNAQTRFCSTACSGASQNTTLVRDCEQCGTPFETIPSAVEKGKGKFCSSTCSALHRVANTIYHRECIVCGTHFVSSQIRAQCCSSACQSLGSRLRTGKPPKRLTPVVFDHFLTLPINASRPAWLTPEKLDALLEAA
ncbi:MAG: hypothetical protein RIB57_13590 [Pelagibacterium sp.]|uniref:hypothetical protein n=1 Tax=Pelagibacterium sp. TaxID=1967288 RepID=UPI0032EC6961